MLREAGDFNNTSIVEYATIEVVVPNAFLPKNLRVLSWDCGDDTLIKLSVSPTGRLTNKYIHLDSLELAQTFAIYIRELFLARSYSDNYQLDIIVLRSSKTKMTTKKKYQHSQKVKEFLGLI